MKNIIAISVTAVVVIGVVVFFVMQKSNNGSVQQNTTQNISNAVTTESDTQYINITAKGGYTPRNVTAKANTKTVIRITSAGAFDCSSSVVIPDLNYENYIQPQQTVEIPVPLEKTTGRLQGLCSMGMYNFAINFQS